MYVDDLRVLAKNGDRNLLAELMIKMRDLFDEFGVVLNMKQNKWFWPRQSIEWLGLIIDTLHMTISLGSDKIAKGIELASSVI